MHYNNLLEKIKIVINDRLLNLLSLFTRYSIDINFLAVNK